MVLRGTSRAWLLPFFRSGVVGESFGQLLDDEPDADAE
jgi:hypothetical protein